MLDLGHRDGTQNIDNDHQLNTSDRELSPPFPEQLYKGLSTKKDRSIKLNRSLSQIASPSIAMRFSKIVITNYCAVETTTESAVIPL